MNSRESISRRNFLRTSAIAGAAIGFPTIVPSTVFGANAPSNRIVMGTIGPGGRGSGNMNAFLGFPEVQMVAVCDVRKDAMQGAKNRVDGKYGNKDCKMYGDFRELLARDDIDAVNIGTPDHWHAIPSIMACKSGKDVYCEKPLTLTVAEGRAMVNAARRYGRVVSGGSQRVLGDYGRLPQQIRNGDIGKVEHVYVGVGGPPRLCYLPGQPVPDNIDWNMWLGPAPWVPYHPYRCGRKYGLSGRGFRTWRDYSGGMMTDWGGHRFGAALFGSGLEYTGPVEVIHPDGKDNKLLTYVFANGMRMYHGGSGNITYKGTEGELTRGSNKIVNPDVPMPRYKGRGGIHGDFIHCVKTRERPFRDVEISHRAATVCHLGNIAYELKRSFKWDPVKEESPDCEAANRLRSRASRDAWAVG
jgi:hypothetical protein